MPCQQNLEKTQPWKAHWPPPAKNSEGVEFGIKKGEVIVVDGTSAKASVPRKDGKNTEKSQ